MEYAQLNDARTEAIQVTTHGNVEWDGSNYCSAEALTRDGKADQFRVVPLTVTEPPSYDPLTQNAIRDGCEFVDGAWQYKWRIDALSAEQIAAAYAATIPQVVTMRQARLALLGAGKLASVTAAINALPSPQKEAAQIEWEYSQTVERNRGLVLLLSAALGLTDLQLDELFIRAASL
jgi:hypothetical protein